VQSDPRVDDKVQIFLKNNGLNICTIQENFVPLQHSCKTDIRQRNCGIAKGKIFVNLGARFSWCSGKNTNEGIGFKEAEKF
jgi:hypothetical protein